MKIFRKIKMVVVDREIDFLKERVKKLEKEVSDLKTKKNTKKNKKYTRVELEKKSFYDLRKIGYNLGTKGRSEEELVNEILALQ